MKKAVLLLLCLILCVRCVSKDPLEEARSYESNLSCEISAPKISVDEKEGNLFIYTVLTDLDRIYAEICDSYDSLFELYDFFRLNKSTYEVMYDAYENLYYSSKFVHGDFSDYFDDGGFLMGKCDDVIYGYYDYSSYTKTYAQYLYKCYELAEDCHYPLEDIFFGLQDYSGSDNDTQRISDDIVRFKNAVSKFKHSINKMEPIRDWFFSDKG